MNLRKIRIGNETATIPSVMLGTWAIGGWLWGETKQNRPEEAILTSIDSGITAIDTAPAYGFGLSEELVGQAIKHRNRDDLFIATKCGLVWDGRPGGTFFFDTTDCNGRKLTIDRCLKRESIILECEESLRRLQVDVIDLYQCHWPQAATPIEETIDALIFLRDGGKIKDFGVSNYSVEDLEKCMQAGGIASNQPKYSLLSREIEADTLPWCIENEVAVLAYSPMEMGLLTGKIKPDHVFPDSDTRKNRPWFQPEKIKEVLKALNAIKPIAEKYNSTLGQIAVAWITAQPGVTCAIVGARNEEQALSNAKAASIELEEKDVAQIRRTFEPLKLDEPFDPAKVKR